MKPPKLTSIALALCIAFIFALLPACKSSPEPDTFTTDGPSFRERLGAAVGVRFGGGEAALYLRYGDLFSDDKKWEPVPMTHESMPLNDK